MSEMRLYKREVRDPQIIKEILEECDVLRIGAADEEGIFVVPVNYGYEFDPSDEEMKLTFYIHGAGEGRKARVFLKGAKAAVELDCRHQLITGDYTCSYSYAYRSIMGEGTVQAVTDPDEKIHGLDCIMEHIAPQAKIDYRPEMLARTSVYRIDVHHFTGKERKKSV